MNAKSKADLSSVARAENCSVHIDILRSLVRILQVGPKHPDASHLELDNYMSYVSIKHSYNAPLHGTKSKEI